MLQYGIGVFLEQFPLSKLVEGILSKPSTENLLLDIITDFMQNKSYKKAT